MKTIFFYDGYKGHGDKTYYAPFLSLTRQVLLSMKLDSTTQERPGCPTQTDRWNCGMFIIMYMYRLKLAKAIKNIVKLNKMWNELLVLVNKINLHPSK